jgi:hypothetical protein
MSAMSASADGNGPGGGPGGPGGGQNGAGDEPMSKKPRYDEGRKNEHCPTNEVKWTAGLPVVDLTAKTADCF